MEENSFNSSPPEEENEKPLQLTCRNCGAENILKNKFCNTCGTPLRTKDRVDEAVGEGKIRQILFFFVALVLMLCLYGYTELFDPTFEGSLLIDALLAGLILTFAAFNFKETFKLYSFKNVRVGKLLILSGLMIAFSVLVHFVAGYMNSELFDIYDEDGLWIYRDTGYALILGIALVGFHPAIFEEMAFRGFLFNNLLHFSKPKTVIVTTGILFAFVHFSFFSLLWHIPIGLFFGYLRFRYRNLWYSTVCHLVYNSTIVVIEYFYLF